MSDQAIFDVSKAEDARRAAGLAVRRAVLGDDYVDAALDRSTEFSRPLQDLVIEYCWGSVWTRPGLDRRTRSLLNVGLLAALGRSKELALHLQGARRNGATLEEIREVLLQVGVYCGIPAAVDAFGLADELFVEGDESHDFPSAEGIE